MLAKKKIRNPNIEIRNKFKIQIFNILRMFKTNSIEYLKLFQISDSEFFLLI